MKDKRGAVLFVPASDYDYDNAQTIIDAGFAPSYAGAVRASLAALARTIRRGYPMVDPKSLPQKRPLPD